jgi:hypothetical protein
MLCRRAVGSHIVARPSLRSPSVSAAATFFGAALASRYSRSDRLHSRRVVAFPAPINEARETRSPTATKCATASHPDTVAARPDPAGSPALRRCIATGPIALADGRIRLGIVALVVGLPIAGRGRALSLHMLAEALAFVVVPAGLTLVDPLTLLDPVLIRRQQIAALHRAPGRRDRHPACSTHPARNPSRQHRDRVRADRDPCSHAARGRIGADMLRNARRYASRWCEPMPCSRSRRPAGCTRRSAETRRRRSRPPQQMSPS